jgi:parallel beta-helix repeat protein
MGSIHPHSDRYALRKPIPTSEKQCSPLPEPCLKPRRDILMRFFQPLRRSQSILTGIGVAALLLMPNRLQTAASANPSDTQFSIAQASSVAQQLLFVNPVVGTEQGEGSQRSPFRTITQALQAAQANTVIMLAPGTYSAETGESFPIQLKAGVTLQGDPATRGRGIVIRGGGSFLSPSFASQDVAVVGANNSVITGVTITNPNRRGYGLWIESSNPTVTNNTFSGSTHDGISVTGSSTSLIQGNTFTQNGANGITLYGTTQAEIRENTFERTGFGINIAQNAAPRVLDNQITQNQDGIVIQANARPVLRNNTIENNIRDGLVAIAQSQPDLGTATEAGNNVFRNNGRHDINAEAARQPFPAAGNQLANQRIVGQVDLAGTVAITPAPTVSARSSEPEPSAIATPTPAATPAPVANSTSVEEPAIANSPANLPENPPANLARATGLTSPRSNTPEAASQTAPSRVGGFSSVPQLSSTIAQPQSVPPAPESARSTRSDSDDTATFPAPSPSTSIATARQSVTRSPLPTAQPTVQDTSESSSEEIEIPVPAPGSTRSATPPVARTAPTRTATRSTTAANTAIEIPVPPPATATTRSARSVPPAARELSQRQSAASLSRPAVEPEAIEIPVPAPASREEVVPVLESQQVARATPASTSQPVPNADLLPVPGSTIPVGNIDGMPTVAVSRNPLQPVAALPASSRGAALGLRYRVVVEADTELAQAQVRSLIPGAFRTYANGRVMMQAGAYSDRANAEEAAQMLNSNGLRAIVQSAE